MKSITMLRLGDTWSRRVDTVNENIAQTVCSQRTLDDHFRKSTISNSSHLFRIYFGYVDGTTRLYPGLVLILHVLPLNYIFSSNFLIEFYDYIIHLFFIYHFINFF